MKKIIVLFLSAMLNISCANNFATAPTYTPSSNNLSVNYYNCKAGILPCDKSLLTDGQLQVVEDQQAQRKSPYAASLDISSSKQSIYTTGCSESGACYGDISKITGLPKTTYVRGYYRKDGKYVRSYYRSRRR